MCSVADVNQRNLDQRKLRLLSVESLLFGYRVAVLARRLPTGAVIRLNNGRHLHSWQAGRLAGLSWCHVGSSATLQRSFRYDLWYFFL